MKNLVVTFILAVLVGSAILAIRGSHIPQPKPIVRKLEYWMLLKRKSNIEYLYYGLPGNYSQSNVIKIMKVKAGAPGKRPTPLPQLVGRDYWLLTQKLDAHDNPDTAPYFLVLDVPTPTGPPYGPQPYKECAGKQCDWKTPGYFGLHGINDDPERMDALNEGSSGCVRHTDADITFLYQNLHLEDSPVRYYIVDI